jgi:hypothetical protein
MQLTREDIKQDLDNLNSQQLQQVADFIAFLQFRDRPRRVQGLRRRGAIDPMEFAAIANFADDDRELAEIALWEDDDLDEAAIEALEDAEDIADAKAALAEPDSLSLAEFKKELGHRRDIYQ